MNMASRQGQDNAKGKTVDLSIDQWCEIDAARKQAKEALQKLSYLFMDRAIKTKKAFPGQIADLMAMHNRVEEAISSLPDTHLQSEWLGGASDDPANHTLKEPNCVGLFARRYTREEVKASRMYCVGPVRWNEKQITPQAPKK